MLEMKEKTMARGQLKFYLFILKNSTKLRKFSEMFHNVYKQNLWAWINRIDENMSRRSKVQEKSKVGLCTKAGGEGDDRGWDVWMASPTWWTWVWASSRSWWWTGKPGVLQSMRLQRVGQDWLTKLRIVSNGSGVGHSLQLLPVTFDDSALFFCSLNESGAMIYLHPSCVCALSLSSPRILRFSVSSLGRPLAKPSFWLYMSPDYKI